VTEAGETRSPTDFASFRALTALLRGERPDRVDWMGVLRTANHALVTPTLAAALEGRRADEVPEDVRLFLAEVARRTAERNRRLAAQLADAARALNAAGIEPLAIKGAAFLLGPGDQASARILADLDLLVAPEAVETAIAALEPAGFRVLARYPEYESHVAAELGREQDVGALDLHRRRPGPRRILDDPAFDRPAARCEMGAGVVRRAPAEIRILEIVLHDLFHDGDYWRGALDLRHLIDITALARDDVDWSLLSHPALGGLARRGVRRHLIAAHELLGAPVPPALLDAPRARLEYRRAIWQMRTPALRGPLLLGSLITQAPEILRHYRGERRWQAAHAELKVTAATRARGRLNRIREWLRPPPVGKI
jgi:hypothetical protein